MCKCCNISLFVFLSVWSTLCFSQRVNAVISHGGLTRTFSFYVPPSYVIGKPAPLIFNLHGYTSNGDQQEVYGDFRKIADTAGFIVVHPNGTIHPQTQQTFWNCGLVGASNVDDIGFIHAMIDTLSKAYSIDQERIYSTGMSNGGFMSYHLACNSDRFAAIASVTGSMTAQTLLQCRNAKPLPILEIHGDADPVVAYNGSAGISSIPEVIEYWVNKNGLDPLNYSLTKIADSNPSDGATAELYHYPGNYEVQHYKIINGGHTWPGAPFVIGTTCMDINASLVIWEFFRKYPRKTVETSQTKQIDVLVFPNPVSDLIKIQLENTSKEDFFVSILDQKGKKIKQFLSNQEMITEDVSDLIPGLYVLQINGHDAVYRSRFMKF